MNHSKPFTDAYTHSMHIWKNMTLCSDALSYAQLGSELGTRRELNSFPRQPRVTNHSTSFQADVLYYDAVLFAQETLKSVTTTQPHSSEVIRNRFLFSMTS